jgi:PAS domain-containing protein
MSKKLATTTHFLESVIDNIPVCVAAKSIEDGRYILANRAFEQFSGLSRDQIIGTRADEVYRAGGGASSGACCGPIDAIEVADQRTDAHRTVDRASGRPAPCGLQSHDRA